MSESRKTLIMAGAAIALAVIAMATAPRHKTPDAFFDEGEVFFPDFEDPNVARTLEVIEFDPSTGAAVPFKVTFSNGQWTIPSHHNYPADGKDRLAQTAAGLIGIARDDFRTDNPSDYPACGVIDPVDDANPSLAGRGKRVTIKGENDIVLADIIVGKNFEGRENFYLVRLPEQKRVYGTTMQLELSTNFKDWIEPDLMLVEKDEINEVILKDYSVEERTGSVDQRDELMLRREGDVWNATDPRDNFEVDNSKLNSLLQAVDQLTIEGVRPKPAGLSATLRRQGDASITQNDMVDLQSKGFYFTGDGRLVSNEGELQVRSNDGVTWALRFGEIVVGSGLAVSAGVESGGGERGGAGENRYLMITGSFNVAEFPEPDKPVSLAFEDKPDSLWTEQDYAMRDLQAAWDRWKQKVDAGKRRAQQLNERFAQWYYVISSESFDKLHLTRADLLKEKN